MTRFKVEIWDEIPQNDITVWLEEGTDARGLSEIVWSNLNKFQGNVTGVLVDTLHNKRKFACYYPMEIVSSR
jgi:hypothetical protein